MYKAYFIDLDGTMYKGKDRIPTAEDFIRRLQEKEIPFLFVTNNATKTPDQVAESLRTNYGVHVTGREVMTSGIAAMDYLHRHVTAKQLMIVGEDALKSQAIQAGYELVSENPEVVLQSLNRDTTYAELEAATLAIRDGAQFIVTNIDSNLPSEKGFIPGSGSITAFLRTSTQQEPVIIGKPSSIIMESALHYLNEQYPQKQFTKADIAMVGDNYNTDIQAGIQFGMDTLMVLTGFSTREDLESVPTQPTHLVNNLSEWRV